MLLRLATVGLLAAILAQLSGRGPVVERHIAPAHVNPELADRLMADPSLLVGDLLPPLGLASGDVVRTIERVGDELRLELRRDGRPLHVAVRIDAI